jgi:3-isopropylmalate dehydrogenase
MSPSRQYTIACLAGDGVGPELMAEASRTLAAVSHLHGFGVTELHLPFGGEARVRFGHRLPQGTRDGYRRAHAVLVASPDEPALHAVRAELDVCWSVARVPVAGGADVVVVGPLGRYCEQVAVTRAFETATERRGAVTSVGDSEGWNALVDAEAAAWPGVTVEHVSLGEALAAASRNPGRFDVVVTDDRFGSAFADALATVNGTSAYVARGWLPVHGAGVFAPSAPVTAEDAGFGVVNPTSMLLSASLLLDAGVRRRSAARTLERAVAGAAGRAHDGLTRSFADTVIELLPESRTDVELFDEVWG